MTFRARPRALAWEAAPVTERIASVQGWLPEPFLTQHSICCHAEGGGYVPRVRSGRRLCVGPLRGLKDGANPPGGTRRTQRVKRPPPAECKPRVHGHKLGEADKAPSAFWALFCRCDKLLHPVALCEGAAKKRARQARERRE
ncbi:unnamed protein product [Arctogadus glacialis]